VAPVASADIKKQEYIHSLNYETNEQHELEGIAKENMSCSFLFFFTISIDYTFKNMVPI